MIERAFDLDSWARGLACDPAVTGVVVFGSGADTARADQWSDLDVCLIVADGAQARYRDGLSWLPGADQAVLVVAETEHGRTLMTDDGWLIEAAVASLDEVGASFQATATRVVIDKGGVAATIQSITVAPPGGDRQRGRRSLGQFLIRLLVGVGRSRRGEVVAAGEMVRSAGLVALVTALRCLHPRASDSGDPLNPTRRVERAYPDEADQLAAACAHEVETCARRLLDLAEQWFADQPEWPSTAAATVKRRLGW